MPRQGERSDTFNRLDFTQPNLLLAGMPAPRSCWRTVVSRLAVVLLQLTVAYPLVAVTTDYFWNTGTDGSWNDPSRWTPVGVPSSYTDNPANATIGVGSAAPYTVTLDTFVAVNDLTINSSNAILKLRGYSQYFGGLLAGNIHLEAGTLVLQGGTLQGATITQNAGLGQLKFAYGGNASRLIDVTVHGLLTVSDSALATLEGSSLKDGLLVNNSAGISLSADSSGHNATIAGATDITLGGSYDGYLIYNQTGTLDQNIITLGGLFPTMGPGGISIGDSAHADQSYTLTFGSNVLVKGGYGQITSSNYGFYPAVATLESYAEVAPDVGGVFYLRPMVLHNHGAMKANGQGTQLYLGYTFPSPLNHTTTLNDLFGIISATNGGTALLAGNWSNLGALKVDSSSTLDLGGVFNTSAIGTITQLDVPLGGAPGVVRISGQLNNTSAQLTPGASGPFTLYTGKIKNGTVDGSSLLYSTRGGTLDGVNLVGGMNMTSGSVHLINGTTVAGNMSILGGGSGGSTGFGDVYFDETAFLDAQTITLGQDVNHLGRLLIIDPSDPTAGATLTLSSSVTVRGLHGAIQPGYDSGTAKATLINQGTIAPDLGGTLFLTTTTFTNYGMMTADGANTVLSIGRSSPSVSAVVNEGPGIISALHGGTVFFSGNITNRGLLRVDTTSNIQFDYGTTYNQITGSIELSGTLTGNIYVIGGILAGIGHVVGNVTNGGLISPGFSVGSLTIQGNLTDQSSSQMRFEIAGRVTPGTDFDLLTVQSGTATVGGQLLLALPAAFIPNASDVFHVLISPANILGSFTNVASGGQLLTTDGRGSFRVSYGAGSAFPQDVVLSNFVASSALELWRFQNFNTTAGTGDAADTADPDHDGIPNLLEFFTAQDPNVASLSPGIGAKNGASFEFTYSRKVAALSEVMHQVEWSAALDGTWSANGVSEMVIGGDAVVQQVRATIAIPAGLDKLFVRLRVWH